jgi:tetratricopeptide (TPR) repeat protein
MSFKYIFTSLFLILTLGLASAYPITGQAIETSDNTITTGTTPDSFWYGLDVALDNLNLALSSNNKRAEKSLDVARERLLEVRQMINENKIEHSLRAQERHKKALLKVESIIEGLDIENSTEEIELEIELEKEIEEHKKEIEKTKEELKLKMKVEGEISNETQALIDSIIANMENSTAKIKIKIDEEKGKTKIKIKQETGRSEIEIEQEIEDLEEEKGLSGFKMENAEEMLEKANDKWMDLEEKATKHNQSIPDKGVFNDLLELGNQLYSEENYEKAKDYYEEAKDYAENLKDGIEELFEDEEETEEEIEIEVEIKGKYAKIKVKALNDEIEFMSDKITLEEIIEEISQRTGLTIDEIKSNIEIEIEDEDEDDDEEEPEDQ